MDDQYTKLAAAMALSVTARLQEALNKVTEAALITGDVLTVLHHLETGKQKGRTAASMDVWPHYERLWDYVVTPFLSEAADAAAGDNFLAREVLANWSADSDVARDARARYDDQVTQRLADLAEMLDKVRRS